MGYYFTYLYTDDSFNSNTNWIVWELSVHNIDRALNSFLLVLKPCLNFFSISLSRFAYVTRNVGHFIYFPFGASLTFLSSKFKFIINYGHKILRISIFEIHISSIHFATPVLFVGWVSNDIEIMRLSFLSNCLGIFTICWAQVEIWWLVNDFKPFSSKWKTQNFIEFEIWYKIFWISSVY